MVMRKNLPVEVVVLCEQTDHVLRDKLVRCEHRIAQISAGNKVYYCSWFNFTKLRNRFKQQFSTPKSSRPLPGVTDVYQGVVRTWFSFDEFSTKATIKERGWLLQRLPLQTATDTTFAPGWAVPIQPSNGSICYSNDALPMLDAEEVGEALSIHFPIPDPDDE